LQGNRQAGEHSFSLGTPSIGQAAEELDGRRRVLALLDRNLSGVALCGWLSGEVERGPLVDESLFPMQEDSMAVPDYDALDGAEVANDLGEKLGSVVGLFVDDESETPTWIAVRSGLFGRHHSLVPLAQSRWENGRLLVPYSSDDLAAAPHGDPDVALDAQQEQVLFDHYNVGYSDRYRPGPHTGVEASETGLTGTADVGSHPVGFGTGQVDAGRVPGVPGLPSVEAPTRLRRYR
jgi:hypothetical protein